jgi:hypothetical protein
LNIVAWFEFTLFHGSNHITLKTYLKIAPQPISKGKCLILLSGTFDFLRNTINCVEMKVFLLFLRWLLIWFPTLSLGHSPPFGLI